MPEKAKKIITDTALFGANRCQGAFLCLVNVTAAVSSAKGQRFAVFGRKEAGGHGVAFFAEFVCVALRTDKAVANRFPPQNAKSAPTGGHTVKTAVGLFGSKEHPILANQGKGVAIHFFGMNRNKHISLLSVYSESARRTLGIF